MSIEEDFERAKLAVSADLARQETEDGRWGILRDALAKRDAAFTVNVRAFAESVIRLAAIHNLLCPQVRDDVWTRAVDSSAPVDERLHDLRLAASLSDPRRRAAYHEAGHAVVGRLLRIPLDTVSIVGGDDWWGNTVHRFSPETEAALAAGLGLEKELARQHAMTILGGAVAERLVFGNVEPAGIEGDSEAMLAIAPYLVSSQDELLTLGNGLEQATARLLETPSAKAGLEAVAGALLSRETLTEAEVAELVPLSGGS